MKTKRAYYDCPVLALCVMKHGIRLYDGKNISVIWKPDDVASSMLTYNTIDPNRKHYIHPDDMHMLVCCTDDLLTIVGGHYHGSPCIGSVPEHMKVRFTGISTDPLKYQGYRIVERNNIPFPWPKFETIEGEANAERD